MKQLVLKYTNDNSFLIGYGVNDLASPFRVKTMHRITKDKIPLVVFEKLEDGKHYLELFNKHNNKDRNFKGFEANVIEEEIPEDVVTYLYKHEE